MTKGGIALLGSAMVVLLCGAGVASAQDYSYSSGPYNDAGYAPGNFDRSSGDRYEPTETVIVRPDYDVIEQQQLIGHINGEVNPQAYNVSRSVAFSDLNLNRPEDRVELRIRVEQTAQDLCAELDARVPGLAGDRSADRECVRDATRNAMLEVMDRYG